METTESPVHAHDLGLAHDLSRPSELRARHRTPAVLDRRRALKLMGGVGAGLALLAACEPLAGQVTGGGLVKVPEETAGPFPGDGSNGPDVLNATGIVRKDIRSSFGSSSGTAAGVRNTIKVKVISVAKSGAPVVGAAVYVWHCDREGRYSLYSSGVTDQNYLRGVQATDSTGTVTFTSIWPACYSGRWPHIHFEVYPSLAKATKVGNKIATSQMAMPSAQCKEVYATSGYNESITNLSKVSPQTDLVFSDGTTHERPDVTGSVAAGFVSTLVIGV